MLDTAVRALSRTRQANAWRIVERELEGEEVFLIGDRLDMRRSKRVRHLVVTVYSDFLGEGEHYRGSVTVGLHPGQGAREMRRVIREAASAARFVKNAYYPLVEPGDSGGGEGRRSCFDEKALSDWLPELGGTVAATGAESTAARVNSTELFLQKARRRIVNSQGVDVGFHTYEGLLELIVEAGGQAARELPADEVELYKSLSFADCDVAWLRGSVRRQLQLCADRAVARPTPPLDGPTVLITDEAVPELFSYYLTQTAAESVYSGVSRLKVGDAVQGRQVRGDRLSMSLEPYLPNSVSSAPWDDDGFALSPVSVVEEGILRRLWGPQRFCYYLGVPPTGSIPNLSVRPGPEPLSELRRRSALEVVAFSDFQVEPITGDFGAEIRLAYLRTGREARPVTGGSVSGNLRELQGEMYLSHELQQSGAFAGPEGICFPRLTVAGVQSAGED